MATAKISFRPDYALSPGALLQEQLDTLDISAREVARRCGRSAKLITEILSGKAPVEPETALQLEKVLDIDATIWLSMEADYRLHLARASDDSTLADDIGWANEFPVSDLLKRGYISKPADAADTVRKVLGFFGVASVSACEDYFRSIAVSYRHSPSFDSDQKALVAWLRMGELAADKIDCPPFDRTQFLRSLQKIRTFTTKKIEQFLTLIIEECRKSGVAFVVEPPLPGIALSGVSRWLSPRKALLQQTMRHLVDDHFWFTFFHEAAHLLLHSRKALFVDGRIATNNSPEELEANRWAAEFLVNQKELAVFISAGVITEETVRNFARSQGIAPGIVVGQLQKREVILFSQLNTLKARFEWKGAKP